MKNMTIANNIQKYADNTIESFIDEFGEDITLLHSLVTTISAKVEVLYKLSVG